MNERALKKFVINFEITKEKENCRIYAWFSAQILEHWPCYYKIKYLTCFKIFGSYKQKLTDCGTEWNLPTIFLLSAKQQQKI